MATQTASSSSKIYDVFLSFCGVDTRKNFTDHLYTALEQKGIITFRDDEKLERGKYVSPELMKAIEKSKYAVIVLSKNYSSSRWCLMELAKIVECMKDNGLTVLPVFYHVDPSHVRNQTGTLAEAFAKHEKDPKINMQDVQAWKAALNEVGNISGWHVNDSHESVDVKQILKRIFTELNCKFSSIVSRDLVGIDPCVKEVLDLYLDEGSGVVRFVGICGMGGMGKTTLAEEIFKRISNNYEASSFIDNVREETRNQGLVSLQKQLLSKILMESETNIWKIYEGINVIGNRLCNKKVLIVLDDVDEEEQLEALAGNHDWFGPGSRIIVTSRDSHLLRRCGMNLIYTMKELNDNDALQLFSWRAFKKPHPEENYVDLSKEFVNYANGLPLALKVLGSLLFDKEMDEWKGALDKLKAEPDKKILDILKISFDGLMVTQKELFLDIACFFKGEIKDCIRDILKSFGYYPDYNISVLIDKSLITMTENGTLRMHDLLQEMGQEIVRQESPKEPGGRSRLWLYDDVLYVLKNNTGTELIEGIMLKAPIEREEHLTTEAFSKMKKLRFLKIGHVKPPQDLIRGPIQLPKGLSYLSNELRAIDWHGYPLKSLPTSFQPYKLVELRMHCSNIKQLWKGFMILNELKLIDLSDSQNLIEIPDLSGVLNLKQLILQRCRRLHKIHASLGDLKRLIRLDLNGCKCLESLPQMINLEALEIFDLGGCSRLKSFPEIVGNMPHLSELYLSETTIKDISLPVEHLKNLKVLSLSGCVFLSSKPWNKLLNIPLLQRRSLPPMGMLERSLPGLCSLTQLDLSYCNLQQIPDVIGCLSSLITLNLTGNNFVSLPKSIIQLSNLQFLHVAGCTNLQLLPKLPLNIWRINADGCTSLETLPMRPEDDFRPQLFLLNCIKLIDNQGYDDLILTMLRHYIQRPDSGYKNFLIPGCEIPKWFSHQSEGTSLNLHGTSNFIGIVVCAVFLLHQHHSPPQPKNRIHFFCNVVGSEIEENSGIIFNEKFGKIDSYHLWLKYLPFKGLWDEELSEIDATRLIQIDVRLETEGLGVEVKKCGARLVYQQDIEDLNQTMAGGSSCSITPYEDDLDNLAKDTQIKRSRDDFDGDGAGPSGEGTSNEVDIPHPKRIRLPNLIERFIPRLRNWIGNSTTQEQGDSDCGEDKTQ